MLFTLIPPFIYAICEQDVAETKAKLFPATYTVSQRDLLFSWREIVSSICTAFLHAMVLFFMPFFALPIDHMDPHGLWTCGSASFAIVVLHVHVRIFVTTRHWTLLTFLGSALSILVFFMTSIAYDEYSADWPMASSIVTTPSSQGSMTRVLMNNQWWLLCTLCTGTLFAVQIAIRAAGEVFGLWGRLTPVDVLRVLPLAQCQALSKHNEPLDGESMPLACSSPRLLGY